MPKFRRGCPRPAQFQPDRKAAIHQALGLARPGDLVILSGRGDKQTMRTQSGVIPLNEREIVLKYASQMGSEKEKREKGRLETSEGAKDEVFD